MTKHYKTPVLLIEFESDRAFALQARVAHLARSGGWPGLGHGDLPSAPQAPHLPLRARARAQTSAVPPPLEPALAPFPAPNPLAPLLPPAAGSV